MGVRGGLGFLRDRTLPAAPSPMKIRCKSRNPPDPPTPPPGSGRVRRAQGDLSLLQPWGPEGGWPTGQQGHRSQWWVWAGGRKAPGQSGWRVLETDGGHSPGRPPTVCPHGVEPGLVSPRSLRGIPCVCNTQPAAWAPRQAHSWPAPRGTPVGGDSVPPAGFPAPSPSPRAAIHTVTSTPYGLCTSSWDHDQEFTQWAAG